MKHLVFYDGDCAFCNRSVQLLLRLDKRELFAFAPLQGVTAQSHLKGKGYPLELDSLILVEDYQSINRRFFLYGKAFFRICWLLGGAWKGIGWLNFFPSFFYDWIYRFVARRRMSISCNSSACVIPDESNKDRFLP